MKADGACLIFVGRLNPQGYGLFTEGREQYAHRVAFILFKRPLEEGEQALHTCDTPACVSPAHLFGGTQKDNMADCSRKRRKVAKLKPDEVRDIRVRVARGESRRSVARLYGVAHEAIRAVLDGRAHRFVA